MTEKQNTRNTVLIIGDVMIDRYISGSVNRISPEAPIPVLRYDSDHSVLGGAGNVAVNIVTLGGRAILICVFGENDPNNKLLGNLSIPNMLDVMAVHESGRPTTVKTRYVSGSHQLLRLDEETSNPITEYTKQQVLRIFQYSVNEADIVVLSDYAKGVFDVDLLHQVIDMARKAKKPIIVDPKRNTFSDYRHATVITPNVQEIYEATGIKVIDDETAEEAGYKALCETLADAVIITRSEKGISVISRDQVPVHIPAKAQEVADVSGAGDTLVAAFSMLLAEGKNIKEAAIIANVAAGISVGKLGTSSVDREELNLALIPKNEEVATKIVDITEAIEKVSVAKLRGKKIGFTNGCFDILHPGHTQMLNKARASCDYLVVGLNSDASVKRLKGESRPVQDQIARATILSSLNAVDLVVIFDEDTPLELVSALYPNALFKGSEYKDKEIVGSDIVESVGGEVILLDLEEGYSTTNIVNRIKST